MYFDILPHAQPSNTPKYRRLKWLIYTIILLATCFGLYIGIKHFFDWEYSYAVFLIMLFPLYMLVLGIFLSYKFTRYALNHSTLEISSGAYFMERKIVPLDLMQSVKVEQGFIMKRFNFAVVTVYTRGDMIILPYMTTNEAEKVAALIIARIKEIHYGHN